MAVQRAWSPTLTIHRKILLGCFLLTIVTGFIGAYSRHTQNNLGRVTVRLYDDAFQAMSYLRSAQNEIVRAAAGLHRSQKDPVPLSQAEPFDAFGDALQEVEANIAVASARSLSRQAAEATKHLSASIEDLTRLARKRDTGGLQRGLDDVTSEFDVVVEIFSADGYRFRKKADALIEQAAWQTWLSTGLAVLVALAVTTWLSRSIAPAVRKAVDIAKSIAAGRLDNRIETRGRGETGELLCALEIMQSSIAAGLAQVRGLMDEQASSHAGQIARQHACFDAALSNMIQGLCLFGTDGRLAVANVRFSEMFGSPKLGALPEDVFAGDGLADRLAQDGSERASFSQDLPDGRTIAVIRSTVDGGGWVATFEDVTEQRRSVAQLAHLVHHDALTGLPNRVLFREHLHLALARSRRGSGLAVLCLDLDRFKSVNDTLGHPVGDALLRAVSDRLRSCVREADLAARLGGDEFAIIQEDASQPVDATALARRVVDSLSEPFDLDGHRILIGASVGIALHSDGPEGADSLLKCADLALYRAKTDGRGAWAFFEADMDARMQARRLMEIDLRSALREEQLQVFYQPLVETTHGEVTGFEALVRWCHPTRGVVSPADFIPLAEEIGLIAEFGAWVLRRACSDMVALPGRYKVAVNLSPVQFRDRRLAQTICRILAETGFDPNRLELEVTESLLLGDDEAVLAILHELRAMGVRIAMDDFGTGYSSLSYLRRFPFDKIKIDQSFIREMGTDGDCATIIRAVIGLGRSLGMAVNAEGVETSEQFTHLCAQGCGEVQGYLFSKPRPFSDLPGLLVQHHADRMIRKPGNAPSLDCVVEENAA